MHQDTSQLTLLIKRCYIWTWLITILLRNFLNYVLFRRRYFDCILFLLIFWNKICIKLLHFSSFQTLISIWDKFTHPVISTCSGIKVRIIFRELGFWIVWDLGFAILLSGISSHYSFDLGNIMFILHIWFHPKIFSTDNIVQ